MKEEITSLRAKLKSQGDVHSSHLEAVRGKLDSNEHYERRDDLILSGPTVPGFSDREDCKQIVKRVVMDGLFRTLKRPPVSIFLDSLSDRYRSVSRQVDSITVSPGCFTQERNC